MAHTLIAGIALPMDILLSLGRVLTTDTLLEIKTLEITIIGLNVGPTHHHLPDTQVLELNATLRTVTHIQLDHGRHQLSTRHGVSHTIPRRLAMSLKTLISEEAGGGVMLECGLLLCPSEGEHLHSLEAQVPGLLGPGVLHQEDAVGLP